MRPLPPTARWARRQLVHQLKRVPPLHRAAKELLVGAKLLRARFRQARRRLEGHAPPRWLQSTRTFDVPLASTGPEALHAELRALGLTVLEGRHTLYLPPQPGLAAALGGAAEAFPPGCGFKLLKRFAPPSRARYLHQTDALGEAALLGSIHEQMLGAAALASHGLGPRPYDVIHLRARATDLSALVMEHVVGQRPTMAEHARLLDALDVLQSRGRLRLANPSGYDCGDFEGPDCNGNLLGTAAGPRYVDSQVFLFDLPAVLDDVVARHREVLHFGDRLGVVRGGQGFLYQGLPGRSDTGRRDPDDRWQHLDALLREQGMSLRDRPVFDVCCNAGLMMAGALHRGASWAVGWDLPQVAAAAGDLLPLLGAGRSTTIGRTIDEHATFVDDLPAWLDAEGSTALFLAAWHHVGFPPGVGDLPWRQLFYEGREHETPEVTAANVATMQTRWSCRALASRVVSDGLCGPRPVVLLVRNDAARA